MKKSEKITYDIIQAIKTEKYKPDEKIPSENQLAEQYHVSRMTARNGIIAAVNRGYLYTVDGVGSFVKKHEDMIPIDINDPGGFTSRMLRINKKPNTSINQICLKKPYHPLIGKFQCGPEDECLFFERVRLIDDSPVILECSYINPKYKNIISAEHIIHSVNECLKEKNLQQGLIHKEIFSVIPSDDIRSKISLYKDTPIIRIDYHNYLTNGDLFEYSKVFYNTSVFQFISEIHS